MLEILLADDHELMRMGLKLLVELQPDWHVCGQARNGSEAVALASKLKPNVAIVDMNMPDLDGLDATRNIREVSPDTQVLVFTGYPSSDLAQQVVSAGARGHVLKSEMSTQVVAALRAISEDIGPPLARAAGRRDTDPRPAENTKRMSGLTPRENQIATLLAEGKSNWCVGKILGISIKTVETHRSNIMGKLALESIVELVHYAVRNQLVTP
jgi:DNA-binding NarL/FixJ family response regulator